MPRFLGHELSALNADERELERVEQSWADFVHGLRTGIRYIQDGTACEKVRFRSYLEVHNQLEAFRARLKAGEPLALLGALRTVAEENVPMPYWLALQVQERLKRFHREPISLHDAFDLGDAMPQAGKKAVTARRLQQDKGRLWFGVRRRLASGECKSVYAAVKATLAAEAFPFRLRRALDHFKEQDRIQRLHSEGTVTRHSMRSL